LKGEVRKMRNGKKGTSAVVTVAALIAIIFMALGAYYFYTQIRITPITPSDEVFYGTISVTIGEDNYLDRGASVSTTSDSYIAYHTGGKSLDDAVESDFVGGNASKFTVGTAKDVTIDRIDKGHFWLKAYTGTDYYLHIESTLNANSRIKDYKFVDVDNDNRLEVVFDVDVSDIAPPNPNIKPALDITLMVIQEDTSVSLNSPADQTSISTGTSTGTIEWQLKDISEKYGKGLARVYIKSNESEFESLVKVTSVEIDGVGIFSGADIDPDSGAKTWYVDIGVTDHRELVYAHILERPTGGKSHVGITVSWETYFTASTDAVTLTLYVQTIGADESVDTALSDAVVLGAA
jgi:hypothetical protein